YSKCIIIGYGNESILKVKDNAGNYGAIFGHDAAQTYAENFTFANFKIDQNADGQQARVGCVSNCQNHSPKPNCADSCTSVSASDCQNVSGFCQQIPIVHFNASSPTVTNVSVDTATGGWAFNFQQLNASIPLKARISNNYINVRRARTTSGGGSGAAGCASDSGPLKCFASYQPSNRHAAGLCQDGSVAPLDTCPYAYDQSAIYVEGD